MYSLAFTNQFKRDYKRLVKRNVEIDKLHNAFQILQVTGTLPFNPYKTHPLKGNFKGFSEAHIEPDWLLVWYTVDDEVRLVRTGSHSDLFR